MNTGRTNPLRRAALHLALLCAAAVTLTPLVWLLTASLKRTEDFFDTLFFPSGDGPLGIGWDKLTLENYAALFDMGYGRAILNSVLYASASSLGATFLCASAGYALAKHRFRGRGVVLACIVGALLLPPTLLIAPTYQILHGFGLLDTTLGLLLPTLAPPFGVLLFRQAVLQSVPDELLDAARMEGCSEVRIFFVIVLPLVRPMVGAFMLITFLAMWNNFITPQIVLLSEHKQPMSVAIAQMRGVYRTDYGLLMAATVVAVAPVAALFLLLQRQFIAGLTAGAVKG